MQTLSYLTTNRFMFNNASLNLILKTISLTRQMQSVMYYILASFLDDKPVYLRKQCGFAGG